MSKIRILALIIMFLGTSFLNEVRAQKQPRFEIALSEDKIEALLIEAQKTEKEPVLENLETLQVQPEQNEAKIADEANIQKLLASGFKADFYQTYKDAASQYGLEWQILAAVHKIETGQNGDTGRKSSAGATGPMQFLPSTFRAYGVDGNGDGAKDINNVHDAIFSAANYLKTNVKGGDITPALFCYNHSSSYVNKVKNLASLLK